MFSRLRGKEKRLERRRRATCYIRKSHLLPEPSHFLKRAQDNLQGRLRNSRPNGCKGLSARLHWAACPQPFPSEGETLRPDGGALESEDMGAFSLKLLLFGRLQHFYTWSQRLCDYLRSNHICLMEINNQVLYSCWLGGHSNGNGVEWFLIWGGLSSGVLVGWCSLFVWAPKGIIVDILHTVRNAEWTGCLL